jgi:CRP/FNR family transcriptional regulator, cyclic AMP receptor protein
MSPTVLPRSGILSFMDDHAREEFASHGNILITAPGEVLMREGEINSQLYVVLAGTFNIFSEVSGHEVLLDTVGVGDCLGEVAIFDPNKASATVKSLHNGRLWSIEAGQLQEFLNAWPEYGCAALLGIDIILSRRLKRANTVILHHDIVPSFLSVRARKRATTTHHPR